MIKKIKLFVNDNSKSREVENILSKKLRSANFSIVDDEFDLGIAVGGDGSFLRMIKNSNFDSDCYFVGINAGTLGFAQEVDIDQIDEFIELIAREEFNYEKIGVQEVTISTEDSNSKLCSLNEIVVRDYELNTTRLGVYVDGVLLENYVGDGLLVSTSFGSTAYNLSFGGSIVYNTFHTLQITPIAPLNSKSYRNLLNSVIVPDNKIIKLVPKKEYNNLIITVDGDNNLYKGVHSIETVINNRTINVIRMDDYNFVKKINDKFLK